MKTLIFLASLIFTLNSFTQTPVGALEAPEMNILYRGYPNKIIPAITNNDGSEVVLSGTNCSITKVENEHAYIVKPGKGRNTFLSLSLKKGDTTRLIKKVAYRVSNLPDPSIYWGATKSGGKASIYERVLFVKYPPEIPLKTVYKIIEWKLYARNETCSGTGRSISAADSLLRQISEPSAISIVLTVEGPDKIRRQIGGSWKVGAWTEPEPPKIIRCE